MNYVFFVLALVAPSLARMPITPPSKYTQSLFRMDHEPYIIGGQDADENEWPWQGYLELFGSLNCGLTVISDEWVMTAAHCIYGTRPSSVTVGLGCTTRGISSNCQEFEVDEVIEHPDFAWNPSEGDDVGVMHLTTTLTFDDSIQAIPISTETDISVWADNTDCWITGWGVTTEGGGSVTNDLQEANIDVYTIAECEAIWGAEDIEDNEHVCVGMGGQGSCNGDSGGPAVCNTGDGYVQVGITSWGATGCSTSFPSVYSNAAYFLDWVSENCGGCV